MHFERERDALLREILALESIFHHPPRGTLRAALEALLDPGFQEIGASGRTWSRAEALAILAERAAREEIAPHEIREPTLRAVAPDAHLLTYTLESENRVTRRASLWRRRAGGWSILHHQGTIAEKAR